MQDKHNGAEVQGSYSPYEFLKVVSVLINSLVTVPKISVEAGNNSLKSASGAVKEQSVEYPTLSSRYGGAMAVSTWRRPWGRSVLGGWHIDLLDWLVWEDLRVGRPYWVAGTR